MEKKFLKTFFLRKTLAFMSLVLGLGLERSCPWPRALCPRLHLWLMRPWIRRFSIIIYGSFKQAANLRGKKSNINRKAWTMVYS